MRWLLAFGATVVAAALSPGVARADQLTSREADRLVHGDTVARAETVVHGQQRYVGGVAYTIVDAHEQELSALLDDVGAWRRLLPNTRSARKIGAAGQDSLIEMTHGSALVQVTYTIRVHHDDAGLRFWMDARRPHDIEDVWGFFRTEPLAGGRTLVTYGILVDMGPGLLRDLFENRVREAALSVPDRVRGVLFERRAADRQAFAAGPDVRY
ncbi:MAG TPA: hypothetical protein VE987_13320 [Polyangiaceae bacterium]|nr:hypothetical protein [Polyangiaceae bacterium]